MALAALRPFHQFSKFVGYCHEVAGVARVPICLAVLEYAVQVAQDATQVLAQTWGELVSEVERSHQEMLCSIEHADVRKEFDGLWN